VQERLVRHQLADVGKTLIAAGLREHAVQLEVGTDRIIVIPALPAPIEGLECIVEGTTKLAVSGSDQQFDGLHFDRFADLVDLDEVRCG